MTIVRLEVSAHRSLHDAQQFFRGLEEELAAQGFEVKRIDFLPDPPPPPAITDRSLLHRLKLPAWIEKALRQDGISTVGGLCARTEKELGQVPGLGHKAIQTIKSCLDSVGMQLRPEPS